MTPVGRALQRLGFAAEPKRFKRQDHADSEMISVLMRHYGMRPYTAFLIVDAARDGAPHAVEVLERISERHKIGWFEDATEPDGTVTQTRYVRELAKVAREAAAGFARGGAGGSGERDAGPDAGRDVRRDDGG